MRQSWAARQHRKAKARERRRHARRVRVLADFARIDEHRYPRDGMRNFLLGIHRRIVW